MLSWSKYLKTFVKSYRDRFQTFAVKQQSFIRSELLWITFLEPCQIELLQLSSRVNVWIVTHDFNRKDMEFIIHKKIGRELHEITKALNFKADEVGALEYLIESTSKMSSFHDVELSDTLWCRYRSGFFWSLPYDVREIPPNQLSMKVLEFEVIPAIKTHFLIELADKSEENLDFFVSRSVPPVQIERHPTANYLKKLLKDTLEEVNPHRKGQKFEVFFENLISREKEFVQVFKHARSQIGEIDYIYRHNLRDHPFWKISSYVCIECKHWRGEITSYDIDHLIKMIKATGPLSCLGVFITSSSFSPSALTSIRDARLQDKLLIVPIEGKSLEDLVDTGFKELVGKLCEERVFKE